MQARRARGILGNPWRSGMDPGTRILQERRRARHGRQAAAILRRGWRDLPGARRRLSLLRDALRDPGARRCLLDSPLLGGWLQDILFGRTALDPVTRLRPGVPADAAGLFAQVAKTEFLLETVPAGSLDAGFPARVRHRAFRVLGDRLEDLPRILWPHLPARRSAAFSFPARENPDEGTPRGAVRLGLTAALLRSPASGRPIPARLRRGSLILPRSARLALHDTVPGSSILLAHRLVSTDRSLRVGSRVPGLGARLARALALLRRAWPEAEAEIRRRTWLIVPLVEPGTVSYSHLARPGISYLNVL